MTNMFYGCSALTSFELIKFNSQNVEYMNNMFYGCSSLKAIDVSSDNFNKLKDVVDDEKILIKN